MLNTISLQNYRNINKLEVPDLAKINVLIETNGKGKSNFLEAIFYAVYGDTFRPVSNNSEILGPDTNYAKVCLNFDLFFIEFVISNVNSRLLRKYNLNGKKAQIKSLTNKFPVIIFAPTTVDIVNGEPSIRRFDLDQFLAMADLKYSETLSRYNAVLKNRNALLRALQEGLSSINELDVWTKQLIELADYIYQTRVTFFEKIQTYVFNLSKNLYHDGGSVNLMYKPNITPSEDQTFRETLTLKFASNEQKEIIVGKTLYGPHKDDFILTKNGQNLRYLGSRGQQRLGALIVKMAFWNYMETLTGTKPIFLMDDVMSELDSTHRSKLGEIIQGMDCQVFLTSADINEIPQNLLAVSKRIRIGE